jgi:large subunit ribosomal protein L10
MKTKQQKQKDLDNLAEQFKQANAAMLVSFKKMTVAKDQELRRQLREAGVTYSVVKNTLARKAAAGRRSSRWRTSSKESLPLL